MLFCTKCKAGKLQRTARTLGERLRHRPAAFVCAACGHRQAPAMVKHCWRCSTDLDRRKRQQFSDYLAAALALYPYSCRRCGVRRYRWGKR